MGGSAPTDMRVRHGRGPRELRAKSASLLEPYGLCDKRSTGLERRFRIPNPDSNRLRPAQRSHRADLAISSDLECGVRAQRDLGYPETYPKKVVAAGGCPRTSLEHRRTRIGLENRIFGRLLDVYGR